MAEERPIFVIHEQRTDGGEPGHFAWDADHQSSPHDGWQIPLKLRTHREDLPGSDQPTEQVLGSAYQQPTLTGAWIDRHNYDGFAEKTLGEFIEMVKRGNPVSLSCQSLRLYGMITDFTPTYRRKGYILYSFTVSLHGQNPIGVGITAPPSTSGIDLASQHDSIIGRLVFAAREIMNGAPFTRMLGTTYADVGSVVQQWEERADAIHSISIDRVISIGPGPDPVSSTTRLAQSFTSLTTSAATVPPMLAQKTYETELAYLTAVDALAFDDWARNISAQARRIMVAAWRAAAELGSLTESDAMALYRPYAGESLYAISNRFYGTPHAWRAIAERNHLSDWMLTGLETLTIPPRPA